MSSGTSRELCPPSLPAALRVKLRWSVSRSNDWCEVCAAWGEAWALSAHPQELFD